VALAVAAAASTQTRRAAGIVTGAAYCVALLVNGGLGGPVATSVAALPPGVVAAVVTLGAAARRRDAEPDRWLRRALLLPGALLVGLASGLATDPAWIPLVTVGAVAVSVPAVARFDRRWGARGLPPLLLALSAGGLFYTLPDPEEAAILLGVSVPLALLAAPPLRREYGTAGSWIVAGLFVWTVAAGGYGRDSAMIGGIACLGIFLASPIADRLRAHPHPLRHAVTLVPVHAVTVLLAARLAGLQEKGIVALAIAIGLIAMAVAAVLSLEHSGLLRDSPSGDHPADQGPLARRQEAGPDERDVEGEGDGHGRRADH
jgi:hypothetical protein